MTTKERTATTADYPSELLDMYGERAEEDGSLHLPNTPVRIIPPREGDFNLQSFMNALEALDFTDESISLEIAAERGSVEMYVRAKSADRIVTALQSHYPNIVFEAVQPQDDPLYVDAASENAWRQALCPDGDDFLPFQVYDEQGLLQYGSDPFIDMIAGMSNEIRTGARVVSRLLLTQKSHDWSEAWRSRALKGIGGENQMALDTMRESGREKRGAAAPRRENAQDLQSIYLIGGIFLLAVAGFLFYQYVVPLWESGDIERIAWISFAVLCGLTLAVFILFLLWQWLTDKLGWRKPAARPDFHDPDLVRLRVEGAAFRMEVQIYAILAEDRSEKEAVNDLLRPATAAYRSFDNPLGCRFVEGPVQKLDSFDPARDDIGYLGGRKTPVGEGVIGAREAAAFWHVPGASADVPGLVRAGSVRLPTPEPVFAMSEEQRSRSALIGSEPYRDGGTRFVYLPEDALRRHQLFVARTRMGKSTLMLHIVSELLRQKACGLTDASIVVVDPHSDLVNDILNSLPLDLAEEIKLIDMSDKERACGINLLDTRAFPERDLTIPTIIAIAKSGSMNWGDRMEAIMTWTFAALYEANKNRPELEQYTIFDAVAFLTDEDTRNDIIQEGEDVDVAQWWDEIFSTLAPNDDTSALAPVLRKIGEYASSPAARRVLGQRRCTLPIDETIYSGETLLVNTARGESGPEVAAIIGSSVLNLCEFIVRQQAAMPASERRRVVVVVDEMQTLAGVRFDDMLAELGKYGGSLIMATQSLERLNEMSESGSMRETILANLGCLLAFQVNATDAALLQGELDSASISEEDILRLPPHHCYGRANLDAGAAYFSMEVLPPSGVDDAIPALMREASTGYTTPAEKIDGEHARYMDDKFRQYFEKEPSDYGQD